jgi:hypothetical protein
MERKKFDLKELVSRHTYSGSAYIPETPSRKTYQDGRSENIYFNTPVTQSKTLYKVDP